MNDKEKEIKSQPTMDSDISDELETSTLNPEELKKQVAAFRKQLEQKKDKISLMNQEAAESIEQQARTASGDDKSKAMTLGDRLVSKGLISRDQLEIALKEQRESLIKKELNI